MRCFFFGHKWFEYRTHGDGNPHRDCEVCGKYQKGYELPSHTMWLTFTHTQQEARRIKRARK